MDFNFSDDQKAIRELAYQIFTDRASDEFLLAFSRTDETYDETLWQTLAEQGLLGVAIPESAGGTGLGLVELCLVLEEQGRRVAPVPLYASLVLGGLPIVAFGSQEQQQRYLPALASGAAKFSAAIAELAMNPAVVTTVTATREKEGWVLCGDKAVVPDGAVADFILVPAEDGAGQQTVFIIDTRTPGVSVQPVEIGLSGVSRRQPDAGQCHRRRQRCTRRCRPGRRDSGVAGTARQYRPLRAAGRCHRRGHEAHSCLSG